MIVRRRPLLRGAIIGGTAYHMGKNAQKNQQDQDKQNEARKHEKAGMKGGATTAAPQDATNQIQELSDMHQNGLLSDKEFERAKAKILGK